jgi:hypothetical protein
MELYLLKVSMYKDNIGWVKLSDLWYYDTTWMVKVHYPTNIHKGTRHTSLKLRITPRFMTLIPLDIMKVVDVKQTFILEIRYTHVEHTRIPKGTTRP